MTIEQLLTQLRATTTKEQQLNALHAYLPQDDVKGPILDKWIDRIYNEIVRVAIQAGNVESLILLIGRLGNPLEKKGIIAEIRENHQDDLAELLPLILLLYKELGGEIEARS